MRCAQKFLETLNYFDEFGVFLSPFLAKIEKLDEIDKISEKKVLTAHPHARILIHAGACVEVRGCRHTYRRCHERDVGEFAWSESLEA